MCPRFGWRRRDLCWNGLDRAWLRRGNGISPRFFQQKRRSQRRNHAPDNKEDFGSHSTPDTNTPIMRAGRMDSPSVNPRNPGGSSALAGCQDQPVQVRVVFDGVELRELLPHIPGRAEEDPQVRFDQHGGVVERIAGGND